MKSGHPSITFCKLHLLFYNNNPPCVQHDLLGYGTQESPPSDGICKISRTEVVTSKVLECEVGMPATAFQVGVPSTHHFPISR